MIEINLPDLPAEAWTEIKRAVGYAEPSRDWTDVERAVAAAAPHHVVAELQRWIDIGDEVGFHSVADLLNAMRHRLTDLKQEG